MLLVRPATALATASMQPNGAWYWRAWAQARANTSNISMTNHKTGASLQGESRDMSKGQRQEWYTIPSDEVTNLLDESRKRILYHLLYMTRVGGNGDTNYHRHKPS